MNHRTCNGCGWVHFAVTRQAAENEVARFNAYFDTLSERERRDYYGGKRSTVASYERCVRCGGSWENFRPSKSDDCPDGCTLNPIIAETVNAAQDRSEP